MDSNFKRKLLAGLFAPVLGLAAGTVIAQTTGTQTTGTTGATAPAAAFVWDAATFKRIDKNNDGKISRDEAQADAMMRDHWTRLDTGNKGNVEMAQFEDYGRKLNPNTATPKEHPFGGEPKK